MPRGDVGVGAIGGAGNKLNDMDSVNIAIITTARTSTMAGFVKGFMTAILTGFDMRRLILLLVILSFLFSNGQYSHAQQYITVGTTETLTNLVPAEAGDVFSWEF